VVGTYAAIDFVAFRSVTVRRDARDAAGPRTARAVEYLKDLLGAKVAGWLVGRFLSFWLQLLREAL
jgi:hypothetical protein